jgi:hypothetical protein
MPALKRIDLKDGLRMHPGEWVSTYIAKAEGLIERLNYWRSTIADLWGDSTLKRAATPCTDARAALPGAKV